MLGYHSNICAKIIFFILNVPPPKVVPFMIHNNCANFHYQNIDIYWYFNDFKPFNILKFFYIKLDFFLSNLHQQTKINC